MILDASIVNIALPVLAGDLGLDTVALAWVITAYVLPFGALLLLGGRLADRFGYRRVFLLVGGAMVALFFALSVYLQAVLGYDAFTAGISQLPLVGILVVAAATVPTLIGRLGARPTLVAALIVLAAGLLWLAAAPTDAVFTVHLLGPTLLIGLGVGAALVAATQLSVDGVTDRESGLAGGLVNTSQQIGGAPLAKALTVGFSWLFVGASLLVIVAAVFTVAIRPTRTA